MKKLTLKQRWLLSNILMYAGVIVSTIDLIRNFDEWNWVSFGFAVGLVALGYILHLVLVRCPACGARLPANGRFPKQCDACGEQLPQV